MKPDTIFGLTGVGGLLVIVLVFVAIFRDERRQRVGKRSLLDRYQTRAFRSPMSELYADQWVQRPYGSFKPEDVQA